MYGGLYRQSSGVRDLPQPKSEPRQAVEATLGRQAATRQAIPSKFEERHMIPEDAIRLRSYLIWQAAGCPDGRAIEHWAPRANSKPRTRPHRSASIASATSCRVRRSSDRRNA